MENESQIATKYEKLGVNRDLLVDSLTIADYTNQNAGRLSPDTAKIFVDALLQDRDLTSQLPGSYFFKSTVDDLGDISPFSALLTPVPGREKLIIEQLDMYSNAGIPSIVIFQDHEGREKDFVTYIKNNYRNAPLLIFGFSQFGADIWYKRTLGHMLSRMERSKFIIHHDSDVILNPNYDVIDYLEGARMVFKQHEDAAVTSFPVVNFNTREIFKPKEGEEVQARDTGTHVAAYGTAGCFLVLALDRIPTTQEVLPFSALRGLYGEWVPFSGVIRTVGRHAYYVDDPFASDFWVANKPDAVSSDVLLMQRVSPSKLARVIVAGLQTFIEFGGLESEINDLERVLEDVIPFFSGRDDSIAEYGDPLNYYISQWRTRYIRPKILNKVGDVDSLKKAENIALEEARRRLPWMILQRKMLVNLACTHNQDLPIPPFTPLTVTLQE